MKILQNTGVCSNTFILHTIVNGKNQFQSKNPTRQLNRRGPPIGNNQTGRFLPFTGSANHNNT